MTRKNKHLHHFYDNDILKNELQRFKNDYKRHFINGETKPESIGTPYLLHNTSSDKGVILVHGLMAAPEEVREWADWFHSKGFTVYAPRLSGHGTSAADLSTRSFSDWMESVDMGVAILKDCCKTIMIGGFSTGAGLALYQALLSPGLFDSVISISAPLKFKGFSVNFTEALHLWNRLIQIFGVNRFQTEYVKNHPDNPHINYHRCPVKSIVEVRGLMRTVYKLLPTLTIPSLIIQGKNDPKIDDRSGKKIFQRIRRPDSHYREIVFHQHGIIRGPIARNVFVEVESFLNIIESNTASITGQQFRN